MIITTSHFSSEKAQATGKEKERKGMTVLARRRPGNGWMRELMLGTLLFILSRGEAMTVREPRSGLCVACRVL
jgi:hypothetical protein